MLAAKNSNDYWKTFNSTMTFKVVSFYMGETALLYFGKIIMRKKKILVIDDVS